MRMARAMAAALILGAALCGAASRAAPALACPPKAFLTVEGKITNVNEPKRAAHVFSEEEVLRLPRASVRTSTVWTPVSTWSGPTLESVLQAAGVRSDATQLRVTALDNFESVVPVADVRKYQPVLAYEWDGKRLKGSKYGPLYVVYPRDDHAELMNPVAEARMVWAVCRIVAE